MSGLEAMRKNLMATNKERLMKMYSAAKLSEKLPPLREKLRKLETGENGEEAARVKLMGMMTQQAILSRQHEEMLQ